MTPLMPCPRCTQTLPTTAAFCRRCGGAVVPVVARAPVPTVKPHRTAWAGPGLVVLVVVGLGGLLPVRSSAWRPWIWSSAWDGAAKPVPRHDEAADAPPRPAHPPAPRHVTVYRSYHDRVVDSDR